MVQTGSIPVYSATSFLLCGIWDRKLGTKKSQKFFWLPEIWKCQYCAITGENLDSLEIQLPVFLETPKDAKSGGDGHGLHTKLLALSLSSGSETLSSSLAPNFVGKVTTKQIPPNHWTVLYSVCLNMGDTTSCQAPSFKWNASLEMALGWRTGFPIGNQLEKQSQHCSFYHLLRIIQHSRGKAYNKPAHEWLTRNGS